MEHLRSRFPRWIGTALALIVGMVIVGLIFSAPPAAVQAQADSPLSAAQTAEEIDCVSCHGRPGQAAALNDGENLSISLDAEAFQMSVHAGVPCLTCHSGMDSIPHNPVTVPQGQRYASRYKETCLQCHADEFTQYSDSVHAQVTGELAGKTPVCSDCHNPHTQTKIQVSDRAAIPLTCAQCHSTIYEEYKNSVHGAGVLVDNNPDVPTCTDCHGVHNIQDPTASGARLSSVQMCGNCHTNASIMDKYGLSTGVMNTYVSDFHGTTITLFELTEPDAATNKPVCYDCHGTHNISRVDDPKTGLKVRENLLVTCKKCHPDATANFPDSWLSHYNPSPQKWPLVYYVNLFYQILIPLVIGAMLFYVITDFIRGRLDKRKLAAAAEPPAPPAADTDLPAPPTEDEPLTPPDEPDHEGKEE